MSTNKARSVFETKTGRSAIALAITGVISIVIPHIAEALKRHTSIDSRDIDSIQKVILELVGYFTIGGAYSVLVGRATAKDKVYSPNLLPGFNKKELEEIDTDLQ
jgi:hypothetical protein